MFRCGVSNLQLRPFSLECLTKSSLRMRTCSKILSSIVSKSPFPFQELSIRFSSNFFFLSTVRMPDNFIYSRFQLLLTYAPVHSRETIVEKVNYFCGGMPTTSTHRINIQRMVPRRDGAILNFSNRKSQLGQTSRQLGCPKIPQENARQRNVFIRTDILVLFGLPPRKIKKFVWRKKIYIIS